MPRLGVADLFEEKARDRDACEVERETGIYPIFLAVARSPEREEPA